MSRQHAGAQGRSARDRTQTPGDDGPEGAALKPAPRRLPHYRRIADTLRARIRRSGDGDRVPSEHQLCARFGVSRMTARHALEVLRQEGLLSRHVGRGSFVSALGHERRLRVIGSVEDMLALGEETRLRLLERAMRPASPEVAAALRLTPGTPVALVRGVRLGDAGAFQHVTAYLPEAVAGQILDTDLSGTSVIGAVERRLGLAVTHIEQEVEVTRAPRPVSDLLGAPPGSPMLRFRRTYWTAGAQPVEHAITYHLTERYPYRMILFRSERVTR